MIKIYDKNSLNEINWVGKKDGQLIKNYFEPLMKQGIQNFIENVEADLFLIEVDDLILPLSVNETQFQNSYVASPYTHYISYAKEELWDLKNKQLEACLSIAIDGLGWLLKRSNINKVVVVNNWFLSTNLLETTLSYDQLKKITDFLVKRFEQHTILFRSINMSLHKQLIENLNHIGYKKVMSRSIYLFEQNKLLSVKQRKILAQDEKLILNKGYEVKDAKEEDIETIQHLYTLLYIKKYSANNPKFTMEYYRNALRKQLLTFKLLYNNEKLLGVVGMLIRNNVLTTPILGYETTRKKSEGLYRVLSFIITKQIIENKYIGNRSAGAGEFKRNRGSIQEIEYTYFYQNHLTFYHKWSWGMVKLIMDKIVEPLAKKKEF
ncbi:hypothetical protein [Metabacillus litoralis]|uniref:hypothetical protein n=1 Tax=Metabacillus litoralis TaxID=152268 RepID=UPI001CFD9A39|nr:hypothetical protein [Metabacillus litoralis]